MCPWVSNCDTWQMKVRRLPSRGVELNGEENVTGTNNHCGFHIGTLRSRHLSSKNHQKICPKFSTPLTLVMWDLKLGVYRIYAALPTSIWHGRLRARPVVKGQSSTPEWWTPRIVLCGLYFYFLHNELWEFWRWQGGKVVLLFFLNVSICNVCTLFVIGGNAPPCFLSGLV